jgi:hypothetical protein
MQNVSSLTALVREYEQTLPLSEIFVGSDLEGRMLRELVPVIAALPSPERDQVIQHETTRGDLTITGVNTNGQFFAAAVPEGEIHRYHQISISSNAAGGARDFRLYVEYAGTRQCKVAQRQVNNDGVQCSMLSIGDEAAAVPSQMYPAYQHLDVYPGGILRLENVGGLAAGDDLIMFAMRTVLRGPRRAEPVSFDVTGVES